MIWRGIDSEAVGPAEPRDLRVGGAARERCRRGAVEGAGGAFQEVFPCFRAA